jgi:hypothetical protein
VPDPKQDPPPPLQHRRAQYNAGRWRGREDITLVLIIVCGAGLLIWSVGTLLVKHGLLHFSG